MSDHGEKQAEGKRGSEWVSERERKRERGDKERERKRERGDEERER